VTDPGKAVFLSYASQDAEAAQHLCNALRAAGIEVWFDQSELRGGDAWDASIRRQIKMCALFIPIISRNTHARDEGYFRLEWKLAVDRSHLMATDRPFLVPVVLDDTPEQDERVPDRFREVQWTRLPGGGDSEAFVERVRRLLSLEPSTPTPRSTPSSALPRLSTDAASARSTPPAARSFMPSVLGGLVILATGYLLANKFLTSKRSAPAVAAPSAAIAPDAIPEKSVAVLPFVDMSEKKDQEYFSDGLSEELIDLLARTQGLQVIARTSSFYFKGKQVTIAEIAKTLNVAHVLEGSVRKSGNTIRVTAQLIRAKDGVHLWSETYDRSIKDVFKVQDEISAAVVAALKAQLLPTAATADAARTASTEAHNQYLLGRQSYERTAPPEGFRRAVEFYRKAVELDPDYAAAYAGLSESEFWLAAYTDFGAGFQRALAAADKAIALAPNLADGYAARAQMRNNHLFDFVGAQADIEKAVAINPGDSHIQTRYAEVLLTVNRAADAEAALRKAIELDPLSSQAWSRLAEIQMWHGQFTTARGSIERALDIEPGNVRAQSVLAELELLQGRIPEALAAAGKIDHQGWRLKYLAMAEHSLGHTQESDKALGELVAMYAHNFSYSIAEAYAWRGEKRKAYEWLERSYQQHDNRLPEIETDPFLQTLRGDEEFKAFLRKLKLPA
jgi:TolB-like protein/Tfp pilus assembly protein PilF